LFGEGSGEEVLIGDVWSDVLLGTEFLCLGVCDESLFELSSKDAFRRAEIVFVNIGHEGDEFIEWFGRME